MTDRRAAETLLYWFLVAALLAFGLMGFIGGYGVPALIVGFMLALLAGVRDRAVAFWPPLGGTVVLMVAYALIGPLGCTVTVGLSRPGTAPPPFELTCTRLLLPDHSGTFAAAFWPALVASVALGVFAAWAIRRVLLGRAGEGRSPAGGG